MLTFLVLFGHWGVDALGDATAAGVGRSVAADFKLESAPVIEVVSTGIEKLNKLLKVTAAVLPTSASSPPPTRSSGASPSPGGTCSTRPASSPSSACR